MPPALNKARRLKLIGVAIALPLAVAACKNTSPPPGAASTTPTKSSTPIATKSTTPATPTPSASPTTAKPTPKPPAPIIMTRPPVPKDNYYINTLSTSRARSVGQAAGRSDAASGHGRMVILDFGGQLSNGAGSLIVGQNTQASNAQIQQVAEQFALGFSQGVGSKNVPLTLGIGTNNSLSVSRSLGVTWAKTVAVAASWARQHAPHTTIVGADDLEPGFGSASAAVAWAGGYSSVAGSSYINYGSADGCPQSGFGGGGCNNGWSQVSVWQVSAGVRGAMVTPEIYYPANATQWALISKYGKVHHNRPLNIIGIMDQSPNGGNNGSQAWTQLHASLVQQGLPLANLLLYGLQIRQE